jgi:uncharacterized protein
VNHSTILDKLLEKMSEFPGAVVAFSGGVDSAVVLATALQALGASQVIAFTADSPSLSRKELAACRLFAQKLGVRHEVVCTHELDIEGYRKNDGDRCYFCKGDLYRQMSTLNQVQSGYVMLNGANADDLGDWRPGMRAASEAGARSPLLECGINKEGVRDLARHLNLDVWDKPSSPCLASRIPYHTPVEQKALAQIEAAEEFLKAEGFMDVRVRHYGTTARVEVPPHKVALLLNAEFHACMTDLFGLLGFQNVEIDTEGLVSGKMNRALRNKAASLELSHASV